MLIRGGSGTGKTLSYLMPILNNELERLDKSIGASAFGEDILHQTNNIHLSISKENEDLLF